jgi:hypothetical protein
LDRNRRAIQSGNFQPKPTVGGTETAFVGSRLFILQTNKGIWAANRCGGKRDGIFGFFAAIASSPRDTSFAMCAMKAKTPRRLYLPHGVRKPTRARVVDRRSYYGNPYKVGSAGVPDRATATAG